MASAVLLPFVRFLRNGVTFRGAIALTIWPRASNWRCHQNVPVQAFDPNATDNYTGQFGKKCLLANPFPRHVIAVSANGVKLEHVLNATQMAAKDCAKCTATATVQTQVLTWLATGQN